MKKIKMMMAAALGVLVSCGSVKSGEEAIAASRESKVVVAYVTSWSEVMPDPQYMTHINYAFGHVNESFNGVKIDNEERLRQIYNPQIQISAESETKRSIFREKDKTKRSKKESAQHSKSRNKSFVMTSVSAL